MFTRGYIQTHAATGFSPLPELPLQFFAWQLSKASAIHISLNVMVMMCTVCYTFTVYGIYIYIYICIYIS